MKPADAAVPQQNRVLTQAEILRKIPHYRFRDSAGKWLPKSLWKKAEILKKKAKLQSLMSSMEFSQETKEITGNFLYFVVCDTFIIRCTYTSILMQKQ